MPSLRSVFKVLLPLAVLAPLANCSSTADVASPAYHGIPFGGSPATGSGGASGNPNIHIGQGGEAGETNAGGSAGENAVCGDGVLASSEACDDGNTFPGDGCSGTCKLEPGWICSTPGQPCVYTIVCGDGQISGDEACDDGNTTSGDGCSSSCRVEPGYACQTPGSPCTPTQAGGECGNGSVEFGESCDDNNKLSGDGCDSSCQLEPGFRCPTPGKACIANAACGDGTVNQASEACDDGNTDPGDGCNGICQVEPTFTCPPKGGPCISNCGNGKLESGEACDDGNTVSGDGCSASCTIEPGFVCPVAGAACGPERCGDGKVSSALHEQCDDGNTVSGDGCSSTCTVEINFSCPSTGGACTSLVACGDGIVSPGSAEQCDDHNTTSGDGCSASCTLEAGWTCPPGGKCIATRCGDGIIAGSEQCDDGNAVNGAGAGDGCSATCTVEPGFACSGTPSACHVTKCGDSVKEGDEQCDDGNNLPYDGCSPTCTVEPNCVDATTGVRIACHSACGDGIQFPDEGCDDGNNKSGDGCSATCTAEHGFTCSAPTTTPSLLALPAVFRDFAGGPPPAGTVGDTDFQWTQSLWGNPGGTFLNAAATSDNRINFTFAGVPEHPPTQQTQPSRIGFVRVSMGDGSDAATLLGKPIFAFPTPADCPLSQDGTSGQWLKRNGVYFCANTVRSADSFAQWYTNTTQSTPLASQLVLAHCGNPIAANDPICVAGDENTFLFDSNKMLPDGTACGAACDGFFPLDNQSGPDVDLANDCGTGSPNGQTNQHNFHFTSEVRYWFQYQAGVNATLSFRGDDDVFVFVNGRLVVDIGGIHGASPGSVTLSPTTLDVTGTPLNLVDGSIYEIAVFQAERNTCASNYRLQLKNFVFQRSVCSSTCGDGVVASNEACDNGAANVPPAGNTYGKCTTSCTLGPFCGDATVQSASGEACDNGVNKDTYSTPNNPNACAPGCVKPDYCGDGKVDAAFGEQCDNGTSKNSGGYGGCNADCTLGPRCGDGHKDPSEQCDDGKNDGSYGTCKPDCTFAPRCGDGNLDTGGGEVCDAGSANKPVATAYGKNVCTVACQPAPYCGDRSVDVAFGEVCDDGVNSGQPGSCTPDCKGWVTLPSCGDGHRDAGEQCDDGAANGSAQSTCDVRCHVKCGNGVKDPGEECDDGVNDGSYGGCNPDCTLSSYCGDGTTNGPEQCDQGKKNVANAYGPGLCTTTCMNAPYCGDGRVESGELCDSTPGCASDCKSIVTK